MKCLIDAINSCAQNMPGKFLTSNLHVSVSSSMHRHVRLLVSVLNAFSLEVYSNTGKRCTKLLKETRLEGRISLIY